MPNLLPEAFNYLTSIGRSQPQPTPLDPIQARKNALALQEQEMKMKQMPEDRNWLLEQRGMVKKQFDQAQEDRVRTIAKEGFKSIKDVTDFIAGIAPMVNRGNWDKWKKIATDAGLPANTLPDASSFESDEAFDAWVNKSLKTMKTQMTEEKPVVVPPGGTITKGGIPTFTAPAKEEKRDPYQNFEMDYPDFVKKYPRGTPEYAKKFESVKALEGPKISISAGIETEKQKAALAGSQYNQWNQDQKNQSFENFIVNKTAPAFPWRDPGRTKWWQDYNQYLIDKEKSAESVGEKQLYRKAMGTALDANEKYYGATKRFVGNIEDLSNKFMELRKQYGVNFGKLINTAANNLRQGIPGSGELANLQQYLTSISLEVAKVESGELGIQAATESQQKLWGRIHNLNFNEHDIDLVLKASSDLGRTRLKNIEGVRDEFRTKLGNKEELPANKPSGGGTDIEGLRRKYNY